MVHVMTGESKDFYKSLVPLPKGLEEEGKSTAMLLGKSISHDLPTLHMICAVLDFPSCRIYVWLEKIQRSNSGTIDVRN